MAYKEGEKKKGKKAKKAGGTERSSNPSETDAPAQDYLPGIKPQFTEPVAADTHFIS
jgi:hypothetical protein